MLRRSAGFYARLYRLLGGRGVGPRVLLLTTVGAKSGERRIAGMQRFEDGDGRWLVAAAAGGPATHPAWFHNLRAHPDQDWAEVGHDRFRVRPEFVEGEAQAAAWKRIVAEAPSFGRLETKTDREIPVVRLTRAG